MSQTFESVPGVLDITFVKGDEVAIALNFERDLTGYTFETEIYTVLIASGRDVLSREEIDDVSITVTVTDVVNGLVTLSMTEAQTTLLAPKRRYGWLLRWTDDNDATRTVLAGRVSVRSP